MIDKDYNNFKKIISELHGKGFSLQVISDRAGYDEEADETVWIDTVIFTKKGKHKKQLPGYR